MLLRGSRLEASCVIGGGGEGRRAGESGLSGLEVSGAGRELLTKVGDLVTGRGKVGLELGAKLDLGFETSK